MKTSFFILLLSLTAPFFQFNIVAANPTMDSPYSMAMEPQPNQPPSSTNSMSTDMASPSSTESYWHQVRGDPFELTGQVRTYYLAAEEVIWDFAPDGYNKANGSAFEDTALEFMETKADRIGSKYVKCLYHEYISDKFDEHKERPSEEAYLGMLGPIIRAEVGDIIKVVFLNRCRFAASVHPHGVFYNKDSEGAPYNDGTSGQDKLDDSVPTGGTHIYTWYVPERAGPGSMDGSSVMWMYHSHTDENKNFYEGLCGAMAVTRKGMALPDGRPKDVDHELFLMFSVSNENASPYLNESFAKFALSPAGTAPPVSDPGFVNSNEKHAINGYMYGNGPLITVNKEDRVRWYVMSMGSIFDGHTPHWHGNVVLIAGMRMDVISLQAAEMVVADMVPDNPGIWLFHCHVNDHLDDGMVTRYQVMDDGKKPI